MRSSYRSAVRRLSDRGVVIRRVTPGDANTEIYHSLLVETGKRQRFTIRPRTYFIDLFQVFGPEAALFLASSSGQAVAGMVVVRFGSEVIYLSGASSNDLPAGAAAGLQFEAMRWARDNGCDTYDLWGTTPPSMKPQKSADTESGINAMQGVSHFKKGFGGSELALPETICKYYGFVSGRIILSGINYRQSKLGKTVRNIRLG